MFRFTIRTVLITVALASPLLGCCSVFYESSGPSPRPFDATVWRRADPNQDSDRTIRGSMVDNLMDRKLLDGMTEKEVEVLLGAPMSQSRLRQAGIDDSNWQMGYHLGPTRDLPIDEEFLMIRLDGDGRVVEYRVVPN